jgi:hypothetical protein
MIGWVKTPTSGFPHPVTTPVLLGETFRRYRVSNTP